MEQWNLGIFTIMSAMVTVIGIILASRFVYVDNRYSNIIKNKEVEVQKLNEVRDKSESDSQEIITKQLMINLIIGEYKSKRKDNRRIGIILDLISLFAIIILGTVTTLGYFGNFYNFILLIILLIFLFSLPTLNFLFYVKHVNKYSSI